MADKRTVSIKDVQVTVDAAVEIRSVTKHPLSNDETPGDELDKRKNEGCGKANKGFDGGEEGSSDRKEEESRERIDTCTISKGGFGFNDKERAKNEEMLMKLLSKKNSSSFDAIKKKITPKALTNCASNSLLMGMRVNYSLRRLAQSKGSEGEMFNKLADSVEDFTTRLLDPMQSNQNQRLGFGYFILDDILDDAIDLEQKKFFTHPVVHSEMTRKWRGRVLMAINIGKWTWFFLHIWCLFDMVLAPITFYCVSYLTDTYVIRDIDNGTNEPRTERGRSLQRIKRLPSKVERYPKVKIYLEYLKTPYFIFLRDTLSYLALVGLHFAFCLSPSSRAFSGLEWSILAFFTGRLLVEFEQIRLINKRIKGRREREKDKTNSNVVQKTLSSYISDRWNIVDVINVGTYLVILVLRLTTWFTSESVTNNRAVLMAGYLYSFNTLFLILRIGHVVETFKGLGTIQIAFFNVLQDVFAIGWQFMTALFAFSVAITKIYMAEKSFHASASDQQNFASCETSGVSCWWEILTHLSWSLLEIERESNPLDSIDAPAVAPAKLFYAAFLFIAVILLVNMLIALLSHTYKRVKKQRVEGVVIQESRYYSDLRILQSNPCTS